MELGRVFSIVEGELGVQDTNYDLGFDSFLSWKLLTHSLSILSQALKGRACCFRAAGASALVALMSAQHPPENTTLLQAAEPNTRISAYGLPYILGY